MQTGKKCKKIWNNQVLLLKRTSSHKSSLFIYLFHSSTDSFIHSIYLFNAFCYIYLACCANFIYIHQLLLKLLSSMLSAKLKCCVCLAKYSLFFFLLMCQFLLSYFYLFTSCSFGFYSVLGHFHLLVTCTCFYLFVSRFYTLLFIYQLFLLVSIRLPTVSACVCFTF